MTAPTPDPLATTADAARVADDVRSAIVVAFTVLDAALGAMDSLSTLARRFMATAQDRISQDLDKLSTDLQSASDQLKQASQNADATTQAALSPIADRLDALVAQADQLSTATSSSTGSTTSG